MSDIAEAAEWLKGTGYPFDWSQTGPPPAALREALIDAWAKDDDSITRDEWADCLASEGGWYITDTTVYAQCPSCGMNVEDLDGFGVLAHPICGYCSHPDRYGGVCVICRDGAAA